MFSTAVVGVGIFRALPIGLRAKKRSSATDGIWLLDILKTIQMCHGITFAPMVAHAVKRTFRIMVFRAVALADQIQPTAGA